MPKTRQPRNGLDIEIIWKPEVIEARERGETHPAVIDLARLIARLMFDKELKELKETGDSRFLSTDPNVDWAAHEARWALKDAQAERQHAEALAAENERRKEARRRARPKAKQSIGETPLTPPPDQPDPAGLSIEQRLALADKIAVAHPNRPVSGMLLELFPELKEVADKQP